MKNVFLALAVGYVIGAKTGGKELDQLGRSVTALMGTDEFADVVVTARSQVSSTFRQLASMVDGERRTNNSNGNLLSAWTSVNGGTSWTQMTATPNFLLGQGNYASTLIVDPKNPAFPKEKSSKMLLRWLQGLGGDNRQSPFRNRCGATGVQPSSYIHPKSANTGSDVPAHSVPDAFEDGWSGTAQS